MSRVRFEDVATRVNTREDRLNTDLLYYVGGEHIESNELVVQGRGLIKGSTIGPMFYCGFKKGDVLLVSRNPHLRKASVVEFDGICSEKTFVLGTKDQSILLQDYLAIVCQSDDFWRYCEEHKSGGVNYFLNWSTLANYEFELPSLPEQRNVADKIWSAYRLKENYKRLLIATDEMVKSQFIEMFVQNEKIPRAELSEMCSCKSSSFSMGGLEALSGHYPIFGASGYIKSIDTYECDCDYVAIIKDGSGVGRAVHYPARTSIINTMQYLIPIGACSVKYLEYLVSYLNLGAEKSGSTIPHIYFKNYSKKRVPAPPLVEQQKFESIARQADKSKFELKKSIEQIDRVIKALMQ